MINLTLQYAKDHLGQYRKMFIKFFEDKNIPEEVLPEWNNKFQNRMTGKTIPLSYKYNFDNFEFILSTKGIGLPVYFLPNLYSHKGRTETGDSLYLAEILILLYCIREEDPSLYSNVKVHYYFKLIAKLFPCATLSESEARLMNEEEIEITRLLLLGVVGDSPDSVILSKCANKGIIRQLLVL